MHLSALDGERLQLVYPFRPLIRLDKESKLPQGAFDPHQVQQIAIDRIGSGKIILWPQYFDARASRMTGRRVAKALSVKSPTVQEILDATKLAGYRVYIEPDRAYPRFWWNPTGRLVVEKIAPKTEILTNVAKELKKMRAEASGTVVAKKKKK